MFESGHSPSTFCTFASLLGAVSSFLICWETSFIPLKKRRLITRSPARRYCDWMAAWGAKYSSGSDWSIFNICTFISLTYDALLLKRFVWGVFRSSVHYEQCRDYNCFPNCLFEQQPSQLVLGLRFLQYHCPTLAACLYEFFKPALAFNYICIYKVSASVIS